MKNKELNVSASVSRSRYFDTQGALEILRSFYLETRNEIKKTDGTVVNLNSDEAECNITFVADGFMLSFIITEGGVV